ncbi:hypothetical protein Goarm_010850 [Gossypium armourianum]|uniref:Uncharacterized protein n=1 Tax=Gossypium armourianum TaxID=34283 RepID=A0A7J9IV06_9ROSI|nr:hypothetical protein [Gossypium armourianum]
MLKLKPLVVIASQQFANAKVSTSQLFFYQPEIVYLLLGFWLILVAFSVWMLHRDVITFSLNTIFQRRCGSQFCAFAPFIGLWELGGKS